MLFSSLVFLYLFLPITLLGFLIILPRLKKSLLLFASLVFYAWGGVSFALVLILSILINYAAGLLVENTKGKRLRQFWFISGMLLNILGLVIFKYTSFLVGNFNILTALFRINPVHVNEIFLPLGISFFTFKGICYLITVKRQETPAQRNLVNLGLYLGFFPTLVAGPIDRYRNIEPQFTFQKFSPELFASGVRRFALGMAKKVIISAPLAVVADHIFNSPAATLNAPLAWLGAISYMLQIYYDFSGYTDMAIGLGRIFGFHFAENFNFPYSSRSISDFWKRWHITLSAWLRDYLFLPLAYSISRGMKKERYSGIRADNLIYAIAILVTFFVCGFWHGAAWTFIIWGLLFGILLVFERTKPGRKLVRGPAIFSHLYVLFFVIIAWIIFHSPNLTYSFGFIRALFGMQAAKLEWVRFIGYTDREYLTMFVIAVAGCTPLFSRLLNMVRKRMDGKGFLATVTFHSYHILSVVFLFFVLAWSTLGILGNTLQSFIYFRF